MEATDFPQAIEQVVQALQVLTHSPLIGRLVESGKRELMIGKGRRGYVAQYQFISDVDTVFVLAIGSQREAGYKRR